MNATPFALAPALAADRTLSPTLYINQRVKELWAAGEQVYHLGFAVANFCAFLASLHE